jgi:hypothetical protein
MRSDNNELGSGTPIRNIEKLVPVSAPNKLASAKLEPANVTVSSRPRVPTLKKSDPLEFET